LKYCLPVLAYVLCLILLPSFKKVAIKQDWVSRPSKERWNNHAVPVMGGISIYLSSSIPILLLSLIFKDDQAQVVWTGMTLMFMLGFFDDLTNVKPWTKLVLQSLIAMVVVDSGYRLNLFDSLILDSMISIVWIVGISNAFNLLDNMDGLAASIGMISLFVFYFIDSNVLPYIVFCSLFVFLVFNWTPASVFMGDCGSLVIGFILATLTLMRITALGQFSITPLFILSVPILDTTFVTTIRLIRKRKVFIGGRDHLSHRLVYLGFSETGAVLILCLVHVMMIYLSRL